MMGTPTLVEPKGHQFPLIITADVGGKPITQTSGSGQEDATISAAQ
jgi:hypothetical protein